MKKTTSTPSEIVSSTNTLSTKERRFFLLVHKTPISWCFTELIESSHPLKQTHSTQDPNGKETITLGELNFSSIYNINNIIFTPIHFEAINFGSNQTNFKQHTPGPQNLPIVHHRQSTLPLYDITTSRNTEGTHKTPFIEIPSHCLNQIYKNHPKQ